MGRVSFEGDDNVLKLHCGSFLVVQWLRVHASNAEGPGLIPSLGTRSHMPQVRLFMPQLKITCTTAKTRCHTEGTQSCPPSLAFSSYGFASYHGFCWM